MSLHFGWFLPTNGDGRDIVGGGHGVATGSAGRIRPASLGYLGQIARSAEQLGFEAALTPTGAWCEDAWLATGMLTEVTAHASSRPAVRRIVMLFMPNGPWYHSPASSPESGGRPSCE